jgi:hypothetical protein
MKAERSSAAGFTRVDARLLVIKWMVGLVIALDIIIFVRVLVR